MYTTHMYTTHMYLRCTHSTRWITTNDHCYRSQRDSFMRISILIHITNISPASVFVLGERWWTVRITGDCETTHDDNAISSWNRGIESNSEKIIWLIILTKIWCQHILFIPITVRKWVIICFNPCAGFTIKYFSFQIIWTIGSRGERRIFVIGQLHDVSMWKGWWCFRLEGFAIKTRKLIWKWIINSWYNNLRTAFTIGFSIKT